MNKMILIAAALLLSACGTQTGDRIASGAGIGAGTGVLLGPIGAGVGALVGAGVGAFTEPEQVNLGEPVWNEPGRPNNSAPDPTTDEGVAPNPKK